MRRIILFDGVCNFCNHSVNIILRYDKAAFFQFATTSSEAAKAILNQFDLNQQAFKSVILVEDQMIYTKTDAIIRIANHLSGWPGLFRYLKYIPKSLRNFFYDLIAKYRYILFGKRATCMLPDKKVIDRFLK